MPALISANIDCYPYSVWGWRRTKGGKLFVYLTADSYTCIKQVPYGQTPEYIYTTHEPTGTNPASEFNVGAKNSRLILGHKSFYQDPSF